MRERERLVVTGLVVLMLILWLGFVVHRSPRFPGSLEGSLIGIAASALMAVPLAYSGVKRLRRLRAWVTARVSMRTLLAWHIYVGILAPILGLIHSGHRFESPLGVALTASMLIVVISGFIGRYLLRAIGAESKETRRLRDSLQLEYEEIAAQVQSSKVSRDSLERLAHPVRQKLVGLVFDAAPNEALRGSPVLAAVPLVDAMTDTEFAVKTQDTLKRLFSRWLRLHIALTVLLYALLSLHVLIELKLGLRWI